MNKIITISLVILCLSGCKRSSKKYVEKNATQAPQALKKPIKALDIEELRLVVDHYKKNAQKQKQIECLERLLVLSNDNQEVERCSLWLADLYAQQSDYHKAYTYYAQHGTLYPGSSHAAYAHMRSIDNLFATTLSADRDQSITLSVLEQARLYLVKCADNKAYKKYENYVLSIAQQCADRLIEHELLIVDFYLYQGNNFAARARFMAIHKEFEHLSSLVSEHYKQRIDKLKQQFVDQE